MRRPWRGWSSSTPASRSGARRSFSVGGSLASRTTATPRSLARSVEASRSWLTIGASTTSASAIPTWRRTSRCAASRGVALGQQVAAERGQRQAHAQAGGGLGDDRPQQVRVGQERERQDAGADQRAAGRRAGPGVAAQARARQRAERDDRDGRGGAQRRTSQPATSSSTSRNRTAVSAAETSASATAGPGGEARSARAPAAACPGAARAARRAPRRRRPAPGRRRSPARRRPRSARRPAPGRRGGQDGGAEPQPAAALARPRPTAPAARTRRPARRRRRPPARAARRAAASSELPRPRRATRGRRRQARRGGARRADPPLQALDRDERQGEHDGVDAEDRRDALDRRVQLAQQLGQRERDDRRVGEREARGDGEQEGAACPHRAWRPAPAGAAGGHVRRGQAPGPPSGVASRQRERPALVTRRRGRASCAAEDGGGVAVLDVAAAAAARRRRSSSRAWRAGSSAAMRQLGRRGAADDDARAAARRPPYNRARRRRRGVGQGLQRVVGAVDGLDPRLDGAARGDLQDVGREAAVGQREVQRGGAGVGVEDAGAISETATPAGTASATASSTRASSATRASPQGDRDQLGVEVVAALGLGLDRQQAPALAGRVQRPPLLSVVRGAALAVLDDRGAVRSTT